MTGRLDGKVVLITGAARGIGAAVARRMAIEGARLWLNDVSEGLVATAAEIEQLGTQVHATVGDASDPEFVTGWIDTAAETFGCIDVLYNNVGVSRSGLVGDLTDEDWRAQQRLTLDTVFFATRAVLPHLVRRRSGSIISMSSGAGIGGQHGLGGYAAAKAGVINLMETVAMEYGPLGIRANSVTPGPTATVPLLAYLQAQPGGVPEHVRGLDLQRLTAPEEVAEIRALAGLRRVVERYRDVYPQQHPGRQQPARMSCAGHGRNRQESPNSCQRYPPFAGSIAARYARSTGSVFATASSSSRCDACGFMPPGDEAVDGSRRPLRSGHQVRDSVPVANLPVRGRHCLQGSSDSRPDRDDAASARPRRVDPSSSRGRYVVALRERALVGFQRGEPGVQGQRCYRDPTGVRIRHDRSGRRSVAGQAPRPRRSLRC